MERSKLECFFPNSPAESVLAVQAPGTVYIGLDILFPLGIISSQLQLIEYQLPVFCYSMLFQFLIIIIRFIVENVVHVTMDSLKGSIVQPSNLFS